MRLFTNFIVGNAPKFGNQKMAISIELEKFNFDLYLLFVEKVYFKHYFGSKMEL